MCRAFLLARKRKRIMGVCVRGHHLWAHVSRSHSCSVHLTYTHWGTFSYCYSASRGYHGADWVAPGNMIHREHSPTLDNSLVLIAQPQQILQHHPPHHSCCTVHFDFDPLFDVHNHSEFIASLEKSHSNVFDLVTWSHVVCDRSSHENTYKCTDAFLPTLQYCITVVILTLRSSHPCSFRCRLV